MSEREIFIGQMPGGSHFYLHDSEETSEWPSTKFQTFEKAYEEALRRVPKSKITVRDAKVRRKVDGD